MSSCFGFRKQSSSAEREPLLPQYADDTSMQRELHQKLHTYQMLRAFTKGYMPSTEQVIINLRTLLASDILNPDNPDLSDSGRRLVRLAKQWLKQFMDILQHKNDKDQIQDLVWFLAQSRISVDVDDIAHQAKKSKARADTVAAYKSLQTVGSLLFTNSDFRIFLGDLNVIGREVFKDSAFALSTVAKDAGEQLEPSESDKEAVANPGADATGSPPTGQELGKDAQDVAKVVGNGLSDVVKTTAESAKDKLSGDEGQTLLHRVKQAVLKLRERRDYSDSVSTIALLIKRYAVVYSRAAEEVIEVAQNDVHENLETDRALHNFWEFAKSFGDRKQWDQCEVLFKKVMGHKDHDPEFEELMIDVGNSLQKLLTDPDFLNHAEERFQELREKSKQVGTESNLRQDVDDLLQQASLTFQTVVRDEDVHNLYTTSLRIFRVLSPVNTATNSELIQDSIHIFVPLLIAAIQYIPIPRLEVSTPDVDLLLENLILEPGTTVNHTSFLPFRLKVETYNDLEIRKAKFRTTTSMKNLLTIKIDGLSVRADELGFWLRAHSGLLRLADEGIASFALDERGIDIHLDVEIARERMEQILTLRDVRVKIHKLDYQLRKSKFSWLTWLLKPILRPVFRKTMEAQLSSAIADLLHAGNRELLYARERLRATRIADPDSLWTFVKAVAARLVPEEDPDLYTRVGVAQPGKGVFRGVYAPGSVVKLWNEEAARAGDKVEEFEAGGWRNEIFDTHVRTMT